MEKYQRKFYDRKTTRNSVRSIESCDSDDPELLSQSGSLNGPCTPPTKRRSPTVIQVGKMDRTWITIGFVLLVSGVQGPFREVGNRRRLIVGHLAI